MKRKKGSRVFQQGPGKAHRPSFGFYSPNSVNSSYSCLILHRSSTGTINQRGSAEVAPDDIDNIHVMAGFKLAVHHLDLFSGRIENLTPTISGAGRVGNAIIIAVFTPPLAVF